MLILRKRISLLRPIEILYVLCASKLGDEKRNGVLDVYGARPQTDVVVTILRRYWPHLLLKFKHLCGRTG